MKIFNINKLRFVLAGICGSAMLVGCVGENTNEKTTSSNPQISTKTNQQLQDVNDESAVWGAITGSDWSGYNSDIRFAINNNLADDIEFLGCDGNVAQFSTQFESIIPSGFATSTKEVAANDPRKHILDPADIGIYDAESLKNYQFKFGTEAYQHDNTKEQCYFRIYDNAQDTYMYFKMVNDVRVFNTYSAIYNDMERPLKDAESMVKLYDKNFWAVRAINNTMTMIDTIGPTTIGILASDLGITSNQLEYEVFTERYEELLHDILDNKYRKFTSLGSKSLNEQIRGTREFYRAFGIDLRNVPDDLVAKLYKSVTIEAGNDGVFSAFFYEEVKIQGKIFKFKRGFCLEAPNIRNTLIDKGFFTDSELTTLERVGYKDFELSAFHNTRSPYSVEKVIKVFKTNKSKEFISILSKNGGKPISAAERPIFELYEENRAVFKTKFLAEDARLIRYARMANVIVTSVADTALLVIDWFVIQPCLEMIFNNPGYGTFNTGIALLNIEEINSSDVNKWNQSHPDKPIFANTKVLQTNSNSVLQNLRLSLKADNVSGVDINRQINISLSKITTPWMRVDSSDKDPWLGGVGKSDSNKGSSVFDIHIDEAVDTSRFSNFNDKYNSLVYSKMGLSELANRQELAAPEVKVTSASVANNGRLNLSASGLQTYGGLTGIFLNSGSTAKLSVTVPKTMLGSEQLSTSGYQAEFKPETSSSNESSNRFLTVRSKKMFQNLNESNIPVLLTRFNCDAFTKTGQPCEMDLAVNNGAAVAGVRSKGKLFIADAGSKTAYVPVYVNYHLITEPQMFSVEQYSTGTYRIFMHNTTNSKYAKVEVTGLPTGTTVVADGCSAGLAAGADCNIDYKFNQVNKDGTYNIKIKAYPSDGSEPKDFDTSDLIVDVREGW